MDLSVNWMPFIKSGLVSSMCCGIPISVQLSTDLILPIISNGIDFIKDEMVINNSIDHNGNIVREVPGLPDLERI